MKMMKWSSKVLRYLSTTTAKSCYRDQHVRSMLHLMLEGPRRGFGKYVIGETGSLCFILTEYIFIEPSPSDNSQGGFSDT